jgi:hypothetical protein
MDRLIGFDFVNFGIPLWIRGQDLKRREIRLERQIKRQGPGRGSPALKIEKKNTPIRFHPGKDLSG